MASSASRRAGRQILRALEFAADVLDDCLRFSAAALRDLRRVLFHLDHHSVRLCDQALFARYTRAHFPTDIADRDLSNGDDTSWDADCWHQRTCHPLVGQTPSPRRRAHRLSGDQAAHRTAMAALSCPYWALARVHFGCGKNPPGTDAGMAGHGAANMLELGI